MHQQQPLLHCPVPAPTTPRQYLAHWSVVVHDPLANGSLQAAAGFTSARSVAAPNSSAAPVPPAKRALRSLASVFVIPSSVLVMDGAPNARPARAGYFWQVQQNVRVSHTGMSPLDRRLQILRQSLVDVQVPTDVSGSVHVCIVSGEASAVRAPNPSASATAAAYAPRRAAVSIVFIQDPPVWVDAVHRAVRTR
jgi:hypothetical protein